MYRVATIENGIVTNVALYEEMPEGAVSGDVASIGDSYVNGAFVKPQSAFVVPDSVSPRQIRQALTRAGLRAPVEYAVLAGDQDIKDWYEFATTFERKNQHVIDMGVALGVTEQQLDDLWVLAGSL